MYTGLLSDEVYTIAFHAGSMRIGDFTRAGFITMFPFTEKLRVNLKFRKHRGVSSDSKLWSRLEMREVKAPVSGPLRRREARALDVLTCAGNDWARLLRALPAQNR